MALPELVLSRSAWPPDPLAAAAFYRGVTIRRVFAYLLDLVVLGMIFFVLHGALLLASLASLGLLWPLHLLFVPLTVALAYHTLLVAGSGASTIGMRAFGLRVYDIRGGRPSLTQAFVLTICFYATLGFSCGVLLLVALFNPQRRTIHDFLSGTIVLRNYPG